MRLLNKSLTESIYSSLKEGAGDFRIDYWADEEARDEGYSDTEYLDATTVEEAIALTKKYYYDNSWASCELFNGESDYPIFGIYPEDGEVRYDENGVEIKNESVTVTAGSTYVAVDDMGVSIEDNGTNITVDGGATVNIENTEMVPEAPMGDMGMEAPVEDIPMEAPIEGEAPAEEPVEGEVPAEEPTDEESPSEEGEPEEVIEPSEELIEPEEDEDDLEESAKLKENAGDPNNTVEIYKNPEFDYKIMDITELDNVDVGDVRSIDMLSIINDLEESLTERYGTEKWGLLNPFQTRKGKHKKTNESYASAILDISIPATKKLEELNTVLTVEVYGDKALKECVVKEARNNKRIDRFCGKTKDPVKFLENVMVDLINNRKEVELVNYQPLSEDVKELKEEVSDEAYEIAEYIEKRCGDKLQDGVNGESILRRDDFDELFALACEKIYGTDNIWVVGKTPDGEDIWDLEVTVRSILGYSGFETIYENDPDRDADEGDLVKLSPVVDNMNESKSEKDDAIWKLIDKYEAGDMTKEEVKAEVMKLNNNNEEEAKADLDIIFKEGVEFLVSEPYDDKGMNFADGRAIEKDIKRQQNHLKQHKSLGKTTKKFDVGKEPDQKNTQGKKVEDLTDTVKSDTKEGGKKKKSPSKGKKKKVNESDSELGESSVVSEDADRIMLHPVKNFDYTDPYGNYYKDDNGKLYKSVDNGNELYICTEAGEPLKDVDPANYVLEDKALNEEAEDHEAPADLTSLVKSEIEKNGGMLPDSIMYKGKKYDCFNVMSHETSGDTSLVYYCNMENTPSGDPQESNDYFFVNTSLKLNPNGNGFKGVKEVNYVEDLTEGKKPANMKTLNEARGLLDDEDTPTESDVEEDSEDLVDVDDELEEGATEVAIFHRKPASVDAMRQAEANGVTVNKSNYTIIGSKELSAEEFENFSKHLSSGSYPWLEELYKTTNSESGIYRCIEVSNADNPSDTLLVDPNGYDYARYVAFKNDLEETPEESSDEAPIESGEDTLEEPTEK